MTQQLHAFISGRVQGVWYRANTQKTARALHLTGWVRNLEDGRVELLATGDPESLKQLLDWCYKGPDKANVSDIQYRITDTQEAFKTFEITG